MMAEIPIDAQIALIEQTIRLRAPVLRRMVSDRKLTPGAATLERETMAAVLETLKRVAAGDDDDYGRKGGIAG